MAHRAAKRVRAQPLHGIELDALWRRAAAGSDARPFEWPLALLFGAWGALDHLVAGPSSLMADSELGRLGVALVPFVVTAVALQAASASDAAWARMLGGAAVLLGAVASLGGVLYFISYT